VSRVVAVARACVQKARGKLAGAKELLSIYLENVDEWGFGPWYHSSFFEMQPCPTSSVFLCSN